EKSQLEERVKEFEDKDKTEVQRLTDDLSTYRDKLFPDLIEQNRLLNVQVTANQLGIVDAEVATKLIDWTRIEKGEPVQTVLEELLESKPFLRKTDPPVQTPPTGSGTTQTFTSNISPANPPTTNTAITFSRSKLAEMTHAEVNELYETGGLREAL